MGATESLDSRLLLADQVEVGDGTPREVGVSDRLPFPCETTTFWKVGEIPQSILGGRGVLSVSDIIRELTQIRHVIHVQEALKDGEATIRNRLAAEPDRWDEQCAIEQASEYESVFKGDALVVEPAMRKIAQELFVGSYLKI
jgi:hypothetical protein